MPNDYSRERLQGSVLSMLTFTNDDYSLDLDSQRKHVRWLIDQGMVEGKCVHLIAGGAGETYMLEEDEFRALADLIIDEGKGVAPTMVMVSELSARAAARKCAYAAQAGIDFVLLSPPHYSQPTEEDIYLHHKYVNDRVDIGIMTYNSFWVMPGGYSYSPTLFEKLADLDNVVGVKWTGTSTEDYLGFQQMFGDRFALSENRQFFGMGARFGMKSRIDVMANAAPRLSLHQTKLTQEGRYDELETLYRQLQFDPSTVAAGGASPPPWLPTVPTPGCSSASWASRPARPSPDRPSRHRSTSTSGASQSRSAASSIGSIGTSPCWTEPPVTVRGHLRGP